MNQNQIEQNAQRLTDAAVTADLAARNVLLGSRPMPVQRTHDKGAPYTVLVDERGAQRVCSLAEYEPPRKKAQVQFQEQRSFAEYINTYADGSSRVFCDVEKRTFTAILDYHESESADGIGRRGEHRAVLTLKFTETMIAWLSLAKEPVLQATFAEFLEDHYSDIEEPDGASVLELAKTLEVKNNVAFKSTQRKSDGGYDLHYEEQVSTRAGVMGTIEMPSRFLLAVQVFQGGRVMELPMRLRFRMHGDKVSFAVTFLGLDRLLRDEVNRVREEIAAEISRSVWAGSAAVG
jgi:uncharacterized protein YfdQ (DUF2303 family)